jgi:hypothetical protein
MNLRNFKKLFYFSKKILNDKSSTIFTNAINSLHLVRAHQDYLIEQKIFFNKIYQNNSYLYFFFKSLLRFLYITLEDFIISIFFKPKTLENNKKIVYISHILNKDAVNKITYDKFYLYLKANYKNCETVYLNHTSINSKKLSSKNKIIIINNILSPYNEILIFYWQLRETQRIFVNLFCKKKISFFLFFKLILSIFNSQTRKNLRYYFQFDKIFRKKKVKILISTFEGFAWEKMLFYAFKNNNLSTISIGYQHVGLFNNQFWIQHLKASNYNPDYILTTGTRNSDLLIKQNGYYKNRVFNIGSNRHASENLYKIKKKFSCIVLPEGSIGETNKLFRFAIETAKLRKDIFFLLRTHPLIDIDKILEDSFYNEIKYLTNIIVSKNDFFHDLSNNNFALYRGSTGIVTALHKGLVPIYFRHSEDIFNIDPIYDLNKRNKFFVKKSEELIKIITNNINYYKKIIIHNKKYAEKFYSTQTNAKFKNFFSFIDN